MDLYEVENLPDSLLPDEIEHYFTQVLDTAMDKDHEELAIANALYELADRQWHTYEMLDQYTKSQIEFWIEKTWNVESEVYMKLIISIIAYLGLTNSFALLEKSLQKPMKDFIRTEIEDAISELKNSISYPYSGM